METVLGALAKLRKAIISKTCLENSSFLKIGQE
jgi:hypothetical protein